MYKNHKYLIQINRMIISFQEILLSANFLQFPAQKLQKIKIISLLNLKTFLEEINKKKKRNKQI